MEENMDKIKINFVGFWGDFDKEKNLFCNILRERFVVEISETPDFIIASPLGKPLEYLKYDCVRILFTGEPLVPDFNVFDYAIGFDYISFLDETGKDRYYRYPLCFYHYEKARELARGICYNDAKAHLEKKKYFCNFLYGHRSAKGERERIFEEIQKYKRVDSAGSFMNNMPDGQIIPYSEKKQEFLKQCKFTIACESISYPGFVTEKITDPFFSHSIPIYYGNKLVDREFNEAAMINLHHFDTLEEGIERLIQIDNDDDLFINMLMQPKFITNDYLDNLYSGLKEFLFSIFSQTRENAYRRMQFYSQKQHEIYLDEYRQFHNSLAYHIHKRFRRG